MSSTEERPQVQVQRDRKPDRQGYGKLIAVAVVGVLILIFVLQNTQDLKFKFLFWDFTWPAWLMLVITLIIGFAIGFLVSALLRRRKKRELRRRSQSM